MKNENLLKILTLSFISVFSITACSQQQIITPTDNIESLVEAQKKKSDVTVNDVVSATVTEILPDDNDDRPHQIFMVKISSKRFENKLAKVVHNIDVAPRVPVKAGSLLEIKGDIIVDENPIVIHWTHRTLGDSPHPHGYIKLDGKIYE